MIFKNKKIERELDDLLLTKNYDEVIAKVNSIYNKSAIPLDIEKKLALAFYYKADYTASLKHFESISIQDENTENLFNVLTSTLALKKIDQSRDIFNKIIKTHRGAKSTGKGKNFLPQLCIPYIRYYYAYGLTEAGIYDEAVVQLDELKKIYTSIKITDDTFLYLRGIPFFSSTLELAKKVFDGLNKDFKNSAYLNDLLSAVDTYGKKFIISHYQI